jgi:uncharacterized protein YbjT (DUF2867 family)
MVVVTTPTGQIGSKLLTKLIDAGTRVRVVAREPEKLLQDIASLPTVQVVKGSTDDPVALTRALYGADSLFWVVPPASMQVEDIEGHYRHFTR